MRAVAALLALLAMLLVAGAPRASDRSTVDRPDEVVGPSIHVVYMLPAGAEDRLLDTNGQIAAAVAAFNGWFAARSGTTFRIDTYHGEPDITFLRLRSSDPPTDPLNDLRENGFDEPNAMYLAYIGGPSPRDASGHLLSCGGWYSEPPGSTIHMAYQYVGDTVGDQSYCYPDPTTFDDRSMLEFAIHALGFPALCAPHYDPGTGRLSDDPNDVLDFGDTVDLGHDDYFGPPGDDHVPADCPNLAQSPYLSWSAFERLNVPIRGRGYVDAFWPGASELTVFCWPGPCDEHLDLASGTPVTLVATAGTGWRFSRWTGGGCARRPKCHVGLTRDTRVRATFVRVSRSRG